MYSFLGSKGEIESYIKLNGVKSPMDLCERKLNHSFQLDINKWFIQRLEMFKSRISEEVKFKFFEVYRKYFKLPRMIDLYYDSSIFTESKVRSAMILEHGKNFVDGFSGVKVKNNCYSNEYVVEVVDGENGQLFCKKHMCLPTKEQLIIDSAFGLGSLDIRENGNLYSIFDFFN